MRAGSPPGVLPAYRALVRDGTWRRDPAQERAAGTLQALSDRLARQAPPKRRGWAERLGFRRRREENVRRGLYLFGAVGRGKSALMDLFFDGAPVARKRRVHFHAFMLDAHARIHAHRQRIREGKARADPIHRSPTTSRPRPSFCVSTNSRFTTPPTR